MPPPSDADPKKKIKLVFIWCWFCLLLEWWMCVYSRSLKLKFVFCSNSLVVSSQCWNITREFSNMVFLQASWIHEDRKKFTVDVSLRPKRRWRKKAKQIRQQEKSSFWIWKCQDSGWIQLFPPTEQKDCQKETNSMFRKKIYFVH